MTSIAAPETVQQMAEMERRIDMLEAYLIRLSGKSRMNKYVSFEQMLTDEDYDIALRQAEIAVRAARLKAGRE